MRILDRALTALVVLAAVNVAYLCWFNSYDFRIGQAHFVSHGFFKPMLILHTSFYLCVLLRRAPEAAEGRVSRIWIWGLPAIGVFWLVLTIPVNAMFDEWNYRGFSTGIGGLGGVLRLFVSRQENAWYRPLGFASLWLDRQIFDAAKWGYHVQNVAWHLVNAWLAFALARKWRWNEHIAAWAAILYACAACAYEPVMWPSARFDVLAVTFTGVALLCAIDFLQTGARGRLGQVLGAYALAIASKESGYALPFFLIPTAWTFRDKTDRRRVMELFTGAGAVTLAMLAVRWYAVGGLGGYAPTEGNSVHLSFTITTIQSIFTKLFPVALLVENQVAPMPAYALAAVTLMAALLAIAVCRGASTTPRQRMAAIYAILGTIPVATLVSWLDVTAQHTRYIYMSAMFVMMLTAAALWNGRWRRFTLPVFAILSLTAAAHNVSVYRETYASADAMASQIAADVGNRREVRVLDMPAEFNGTLFGQFEVQYKFETRRPDVPIRFVGAAEGCGDALCYRWQPEARDIRRVSP